MAVFSSRGGTERLLWEFLRKILYLEHQMNSLGQEMRAQMVDERRSAAEKVEDFGIPEKAVKNFLRSEITEAEACLQLPWALAAFLSFAASVFFHDRTELHAARREALLEASRRREPSRLERSLKPSLIPSFPPQLISVSGL